jgi:hypothetical protein
MVFFMILTPGFLLKYAAINMTRVSPVPAMPSPPKEKSPPGMAGIRQIYGPDVGYLKDHTLSSYDKGF